MKIQVCILSPTNVNTPSVKLLQKYFGNVTIYTDSFKSFSDARNKCIDPTADYVIRFDADEEIDEDSIIQLKQDLPGALVYVKFQFFVDEYSWVDGFKLISHPTNCRYIGPAHETLVCNTPLKRIYDDKITLIHRKSTYDYYYSMARTYYLMVPDIELRKIIGGEVTVDRFRRAIKKPSKKLKNWAENQTGCNPRRAFYYLIFGETPNECALDPPKYAEIANKVYEKVKIYEGWLPYYVATHPDVDIDRIAELNRIYLHLLGRPIDEHGLKMYYDMPNEKVVEAIINSLLLKKEDAIPLY
ncbi:MAG: hypothetical protein OWQ50_02800 [Acidianus infernus]|nr:hypothetical protein [Acidianus infernus]